MKKASNMYKGLLGLFFGLIVLGIGNQAPAQGDTWATKTSRPTAVSGSAAGIIDGILYVIGGQVSGEGGSINVVEAYDPVSDTWTTKAPIPKARSFAAPGVINGKLYVVCGIDPFDISQVDIYDPVANSWSTATNPMVNARGAVASGVIDGILYVVGGDVFGQNASVNTLRAYNSVADIWVLKASMPTDPRQRAAVVVIDGKLYVIGGATCCSPLTILEIYDPVSDFWTPAPPSPKGKDGLVAGVIGGKFYAVSGLADPGNGINTSTNENNELKTPVIPVSPLWSLWFQVFI